MTGKISRRDLVILTGAGLFTSSCGQRDADLVEDCTRAVEKARGKPVFLGSPGDPWGADPHDSHPTGGQNKYPAFAPGYIAVAYLGLQSDWSIRVNQASYVLGSSEDSLEKAVKTFTALTGGAKRRFKYLNTHLKYDPYK